MNPPTEEIEQRRLARWLDARGANWFHVPNGGLRHRTVAAKLRLQGVKRGVPDVLIITQPPIALELKRQKGGRVSPEQKAWLATFTKNGWRTYVAKGAQDAIAWLEGEGV